MDICGYTRRRIELDCSDSLLALRPKQTTTPRLLVEDIL